MLQEFGKHSTKKTAKLFDAKTRRVRKAKHFNPHDPDAHVPNTVAEVRDEIGLICAIAVKEHSSSKRKELFQRVQEREGVAHPQQLLIDMPVCWSSMYAMLNCAEKNKDHVETFVYKMGHEEKNILFLDLLAYADFQPVLEVAIAKVLEYYDLMHNHDVFIIAMLLDPVQKAKHFKHHWSKAHHDKVLNHAEQLFKEHYEELYGNFTHPPPVKKAKGSKIKTLLCEIFSDDEDDEHVETQNAHRYPVWASLALDYLSVMAASVSSESAFLQAGITISKHQSHLKADIVEALQFLKCLLHRELFFHCAPSSIDEVDIVDVGEGQDVTEVDKDEEAWDDVLGDFEDDDENTDYNSL
ncbi:hypothetical protein EWM64_g3907 [Hericium alpestre]|uniref:HAT C-terminal dimerisation domain-containing protein n=1 Tax=Hericium alpestre TaxID=135208 RepID=A0A4Z0A054_9AGAM|nr:hypothetical protein EWM64_g3907 [Hericium alpestre]